jgi:hypothetical protein
LKETRHEMKLLRNMLVNATGASSETLVRKLQSERDDLVADRNAAIDYALMLRQLELPSFINRFQQRVSEPLFRLYNLLGSLEDLGILSSPLFLEAHSALSDAVPSVTSEACRAQLALRTALEDFDLQFPRIRELLRVSHSCRSEQSLAQNAGMEPVVSPPEPIFNSSRLIRYGRYLRDYSDLFPLQSLRDTEGHSLREAIRGLLDSLNVVAYTPTSPGGRAISSSSIDYSPLANPTPSSTRSNPPVPPSAVVAQNSNPVALVEDTVLAPSDGQGLAVNPPEVVEDLEYVSNGEIFGRQGDDEEEEDELDKSSNGSNPSGEMVRPGVLDLEVSVTVAGDDEV